MKFKNRYNRSMATEVRIVTTLEGWQLESLLGWRMSYLFIWVLVTHRCLLKWAKGSGLWEMLGLCLVLETMNDVFKKR